MPTSTQVELLQAPISTEEVRFLRFAIVGGRMEGTLASGEIVEVELIHYKGATGETHITYYQEGETRLLVHNSGREIRKERVF
jgi:hypothetical protein